MNDEAGRIYLIILHHAVHGLCSGLAYSQTNLYQPIIDVPIISAYNRNIVKRLARKLVWLRETMVDHDAHM